MRKVPTKNYIKLLITIVLTISLALLLSNVYLKRQSTKTTPMYDFVSQITEKDIDDFFIEKDSAVIYAANKQDLSIKKFEKNLIENIKQNSLKELFVYLDVNNDSLTDSFKSKYNWKINFEEAPLLILFKDHKICDIIYIDVDNFDFNEIVKAME